VDAVAMMCCDLDGGRKQEEDKGEEKREDCGVEEEETSRAE